jgi:Asp-tRNA(Asn)/Glu-tRNA(Gln) amidotransferase A subunit family amidase
MEPHDALDDGRDIVGLNARSIVQLLREGTLSCEVVVSKFLDNINQKNSQLNAFVDVNSNALRDARELDANGEKRGPLYGLPV